MTKSRAAFDLLLATDAETTGIAMGCVDPTFNPETGEKFQAISFGFVVARADTFQPVDELYVEIKYDDRYVWSDGAQRVHGLTREYLEENGMTRQEAAFKIVEFIQKYFGPVETIRKLVLLGQNVATFDRYFLIELLSEVGADIIQFGNRHVDTFSIGLATLGVYSSNELFDALGLERDPNNHNALEDTKHALKAARLIKKFIQSAE